MGCMLNTGIRRALPALFALVLIASVSRAQVTPRPDEKKTLGTTVPDVTLVGEDSTTFALSTLAGKPIILNPIFTSCPYVCPQITTSLRDALAKIGEPGAGYQVLTISFDPADGPAALREYRKQVSLPAGWKLATGTPEQVSALLGAIDFRYVPLEEGGFVHANVIAVLSPALTVSGYVNGVEYSEADVRAALEKAASDVSLVKHYRPFSLGVALAGVLAVVVALVATRRKPKPA